jgi:SAM-dependent methyltransferase
MQDTLDVEQLRTYITDLERAYKAEFRIDSARRLNISRASRLYRDNGTLVDLGGGISPHNGLLAKLGMTVYVIDLLGEYWEHRATAPADISQEVRLLKACGVRFIPHDISTCDLRDFFPANSVDVITSFHCIEHLHRSPQLLLESALEVLKPGGLLVIEVPNAVNARKRLAVLCGRTNYGSYNEFYYSPVFLGHVREYTVGDLRVLAHNLRISRYRISGSNNIYGSWADAIPRLVRGPCDRILRAFPGLCSCLLLEATKS